MDIKTSHQNRPLKESSLTRLNKYLESSNVAFITAFKSNSWIKDHYDVENFRDIKKINRERNNELLNILKTNGYNTFKVDGSYYNQERDAEDKEESFAVIDTNHKNDFIDTIVDLGRLYDQESILVIFAGNNKYAFYYMDGHVEEFNGKGTFGKDSDYKSLVNGRPFVLENVEHIDRDPVRSKALSDKLLHQLKESKIDESTKSNILKKMQEYNKKHQKGGSPWIYGPYGNIKMGVDMFNDALGNTDPSTPSTSIGNDSGMSMGESVEDEDFDAKWNEHFGEPTTDVISVDQFDKWIQEVIDLDLKKYHENFKESVEDEEIEKQFVYIGNFYVNGIDGDINIGKDSIEVISTNRQSAINKIIRKFKSTHLSFLTAVHNGWKTNVFIDDDKVIENITDKSLAELEKEYEEENSKEQFVDDPKYNFDDEDREDDYQVESISSIDAVYELNRLNESLKEQTAYMLKYDGSVYEVEAHPYICLYNKANINNIKFRSNDIDWLYDHTSDEFTKNEIKSVVNSVPNNLSSMAKYKLGNAESTYIHDYDIEYSLLLLQHELDQEFCRVRMSDKYGKGIGKDCYIRISSVGFDWFNIIWDFILKNRADIDTITIVTDYQSTKTDKEVIYKTRDGQLIDHMNVDEFLALEKSPIIEEFRSVREMFNHCNLYNTNWLFESAREDLGAGCSAKELSESIAKSREIIKNFDKEKFIERMKNRYNLK